MILELFEFCISFISLFFSLASTQPIYMLINFFFLIFFTVIDLPFEVPFIITIFLYIYVGSIVVLFVFIIMVLNLKSFEDSNNLEFNEQNEDLFYTFFSFTLIFNFFWDLFDSFFAYSFETLFIHESMYAHNIFMNYDDSDDDEEEDADDESEYIFIEDDIFGASNNYFFTETFTLCFLLFDIYAEETLFLGFYLYNLVIIVLLIASKSTQIEKSQNFTKQISRNPYLQFKSFK